MEAHLHITFSPMRHDDTLKLARKGDTLVINGEPFDFADLPEGGSLPVDAIASVWFAGPVQRLNGVLQFALILPHGRPAPEATLFPAPVTVTADGPIDVPPYSTEEPA